jgi:hypothetical protein
MLAPTARIATQTFDRRASGEKGLDSSRMAT